MINNNLGNMSINFTDINKLNSYKIYIMITNKALLENTNKYYENKLNY